jgi:hypothetical protein
MASMAASVGSGAQFADDFDALAAWTVVTSDGVEATISPAEGPHGQCLRLDFDFQRGTGFCVVRRSVDLELPKNYCFTFEICGEAPANNLEFKLVDSSGENVWWVNRRNFVFPREWQTLRQKARHFRFAWGPSGGRPLEHVGAIELAVASSTGGHGYILLDQLQFESLPETPTTSAPVAVTFSSQHDTGVTLPSVLPESGMLPWRSDEHDSRPWLQFEFHPAREVGGLRIEWDRADYATAYDVALSDDGKQWRKVAAVTGGNGGRDYIPLPEAGGAQLRIAVQATSRQRGVGLRSVRLMDPEFADSPNNMFATIAHDLPRGWLPSYFLGLAQPWTVVGVASDEKEALLGADGALEVDKSSFRLEPMLLIDGRLITWADVVLEQSLADECLPIPTASWRYGGWRLEVTGLADGAAGSSRLVAHYGLTNGAADEQRATLFLALRPFQVLPPWHELNIVGGTCPISTIRWDGARVTVNDDKIVQPWTKPSGFGAVDFMRGDVVEFLAAGELPPDLTATDPLDWASGALRYDFDLPAGATRTVTVEVPFYPKARSEASALSEGSAEARFATLLKQSCDFWWQEVHRVRLCLPAAAAPLTNTFRTAQAHILINADGPAIQPGSRTYERSWIRDGASTSTALLYTGHPEPVRAFLDWYGGYQYPSGKIPCVVDRRGPDPVPEHDSTGEFIHAILNYYCFTDDRAFLEKHWSQVAAGVRYIQALRAERLTDAYRDGPPPMKACYGLVPESISHEGYSAKPMHSYWDDFYTLRGLSDAVSIAGLLGRAESEAEFRTARDDLQFALAASVRQTIAMHKIEYIPGCVELGDFDATSTAIALFPCELDDLLPRQELRRTFARYYDFFDDRRAGRIAWENYTPYEIRIAGALLRLDQPQQARALLDFFLADRRPPGWNQWAEVVWRDAAAPRFVGDMPHTWVASEFINVVRSLFVYERARDQALVLAAGIDPAWLADTDGVRIEDFPTAYGRLSYTARAPSDRLEFMIDGNGLVPPGGVVLVNPDARPIRAVRVDGHSVDTFDDRAVHVSTVKATVEITYGT